VNDASVKAFEEAHTEFLTAERLFHARQCGLQELDAKFHILKRLAAGAVAADSKYQATIAGVINRMRVIQRKVSEGEDPHVERQAEHRSTTKPTVRPRTPEVAIVAALLEAERCIANAQELYDHNRFSEMIADINRAVDITNRLSRLNLQFLTEGDRRTVVRNIENIRAQVKRLRQMRDQSLLLRKSAATKTKMTRKKIHLGPLGWFFGMVVCVAGANLIFGTLGYIWDNFPYLFFFLPLVYVWVYLGFTKR
jgi:hypothetical protein